MSLLQREGVGRPVSASPSPTAALQFSCGQALPASSKSASRAQHSGWARCPLSRAQCRDSWALPQSPVFPQGGPLRSTTAQASRGNSVLRHSRLTSALSSHLTPRSLRAQPAAALLVALLSLQDQRHLTYQHADVRSAVAGTEQSSPAAAPGPALGTWGSCHWPPAISHHAHRSWISTDRSLRPGISGVDQSQSCGAACQGMDPRHCPTRMRQLAGSSSGSGSSDEA
ncbi:hypothetical protein NDU88_000332 [Pleurodeles waltl]|uniref:Uncharacterized protein n=1 Tax=Pleurodeles waltl TaxID=8319 RepID=A0AAV7TFG1_PLEWA|nr:hypothetical protein NDU88_000332 [Pleurodeles waltl]